MQVVAVGKARPPLDVAAREYEGRIADRVGFRVDEVAIGVGDPREAARREAEKIGKALLDRAYVVALDAGGRPFATSSELASWLARRLEVPTPTAFVIGGPGGLEEQLLSGADERRSLGPLTLPHQLARVVLVEQLYRGLCELDGHPYPR